MNRKHERHLHLPLLLLGLLGLSACREDGLVGPRPQWSDLVAYPPRAAVLSGEFDLTLVPDGVVDMVVSIDGVTLGRVAESPFSWPMDVRDYEVGEHTLGVAVSVGGLWCRVSTRVLLCYGVGTSVGNFAPMFYLDDLDGVTHTPVASPDTKVILLDYWATWCAPCCAALPETQRLFEEYGDRGLEVLTINWESKDTVEQFMLDNGYTFPVLLDQSAGVAHSYNVDAIPMYFLIDRRGIVRFVRLGAGGTPLEDIITQFIRPASE